MGWLLDVRSAKRHEAVASGRGGRRGLWEELRNRLGGRELRALEGTFAGCLYEVPDIASSPAAIYTASSAAPAARFKISTFLAVPRACAVQK